MMRQIESHKYYMVTKIQHYPPIVSRTNGMWSNPTSTPLTTAHLLLQIVLSNSLFLNQARYGLRPVCACFLKIDPVRIISMRACVCVCARGY